MPRLSIQIQGAVQGVGFRPFVYNLATHLNLTGFVRNDLAGVTIEAQGAATNLSSLVTQLCRNPPPLARIDHVSTHPLPELPTSKMFHVEHSTNAIPGPINILPDVATCPDCLNELFNPQNRRHHYPFLNCTNCGPRLTIIQSAPYDRANTTMSTFQMCPLCQHEYNDPANRRFHAQPTCCPTCGPQLKAHDAHGNPLNSINPLHQILTAIHDGKIAAIKGLGGYHLAANAQNHQAVSLLRQRKHREEKPFALMAQSIHSIQQFAEVSPEEESLLLSKERPIVLLKKRPSAILPNEIAPKNPRLGFMLPYTPLHHLLMHFHPAPLVMTSANQSDEPIATTEPEVFDRLKNIADVYLTHNRPINVRCDDSITRIFLSTKTESPLRRSRGHAPAPIPLPIPCPQPILAVGAQLKSTFALGRDSQAILSHHLGDLDHYQAFQSFQSDLALYQNLFNLHPKFIAHDLHPNYASTQFAQSLTGITLLPIQHHHAHVAAVMAEHQITTPVIGVAFDGTGLGTDNAIWGGEFLIATFLQFRRAAHLRYVALPGSDAAIREPWHIAMSHLLDANAICPTLRDRIPQANYATVQKMIQSNFNSPPTSSAGRLFDAVSSLLNLRDKISYEGQAAIELEHHATQSSNDHPYPFALEESPNQPIQIDTRPLIRAITDDVASQTPTPQIARRFHQTLAAMIHTTCQTLRRQTQINTVTLSGGVFSNELLTSLTTTLLQNDNFQVLSNQKIPPNDASISLGQLAIAAATLNHSNETRS